MKVTLNRFVIKSEASGGDMYYSKHNKWTHNIRNANIYTSLNEVFNIYEGLYNKGYYGVYALFPGKEIYISSRKGTELKMLLI